MRRTDAVSLAVVVLLASWGLVVLATGVAALLSTGSGELNANDRMFVGYFWASVAIWAGLWAIGLVLYRRRSRS